MADIFFDPYFPANARALNVESFTALEFGASGEVVRVYGRADPIVVTDVRPWPTGTLRIVTLDSDERVWLEALLATGRIIGFSPDPTLAAGLPATSHQYVGKVTQERVSKLARHQERRWTLDVTLVAAPVVRV
jgi:hypothetical protein